MNEESRKRIVDIAYAEIGNSPDELIPAVSTLLNYYDAGGVDFMSSQYSSFVKKSPQYQKANARRFNDFEQNAFNQIDETLAHLLENPNKRMKFTGVESEKNYSIPNWKEEEVVGEETYGNHVYYYRKNPAMQVAAVQKTLSNQGYNPGVIDGLNGNNTINSIRAYQKDNDLIIDGKIGPQTLGALGLDEDGNKIIDLFDFDLQ